MTWMTGNLHRHVAFLPFTAGQLAAGSETGTGEWGGGGGHEEERARKKTKHSLRTLKEEVRLSESQHGPPVTARSQGCPAAAAEYLPSSYHAPALQRSARDALYTNTPAIIDRERANVYI